MASRASDLCRSLVLRGVLVNARQVLDIAWSPETVHDTTDRTCHLEAREDEEEDERPDEEWSPWRKGGGSWSDPRGADQSRQNFASDRGLRRSRAHALTVRPRRDCITKLYLRPFQVDLLG
jgi:hypothetical protein